jgi:hypothetical protein
LVLPNYATIGEQIITRNGGLQIRRKLI